MLYSAVFDLKPYVKSRFCRFTIGAHSQLTKISTSLDNYPNPYKTNSYMTILPKEIIVRITVSSIAMSIITINTNNGMNNCVLPSLDRLNRCFTLYDISTLMTSQCCP